MTSKKTLNAQNLEALGARRLAELLIEIIAGDPASKRRLRLELAGQVGPAAVVQEVRKCLAMIARSRSFVDWQNRRALVDDLETQRRAIVKQVAKRDPVAGLELMWRFLALASSVFERCDDSSGEVSDVFYRAVSDFGEIAVKAKIDPKTLAGDAFRAITHNDYGQYDPLIGALAPALAQEGLEHLKQNVIALSKEAHSKPSDRERRQIGFGSDGPIYADEVDKQFRSSTVRQTLMEIADVQGDVDTYIVLANMTSNPERCRVSLRKSSAGYSQQTGQTTPGG